MTTQPLDKNRNLAAADQAAQRQFGDEDLSSPTATCPARQAEIFVVPSRYAMAEQAAEHADFQPASPTQSHPLGLRRLRAGYLYLWHAEGPLKRYAVATDGLLVEQPLTQAHAAIAAGEKAGVALNKSTDAWMLYSEMPLSEEACERLKKNEDRRKRMRQVGLPEIANRLTAKHCPPLEKAPALVAELMPAVRDTALAHDYQQNGAAYREGLKKLGDVIKAAPTHDNIKAYIASSQFLRDREEAAGTQPPGEPLVEPGIWSATPWEVDPTQAWLDKAKGQSAALYAVFAALDDDLGVLRDINHEQNKVEAEHEEWVADNSLRQTIGSFIRGLITEDGGEVANLLNYRYREHNLQLTPDQGDTLIDSQKQLNTLLAEETRINQQRGRQYGHTQADTLLAQVRNREEAVLSKVRSFIPSGLHHEAQQVVREYRQEKVSNLQGANGATKLGEYIDLASMNHWLDQQAPQHFTQVETRHRLLYADRKTYLPRSESGTWFVDQSSEDHLKWLENLTIACLSAQCSRSEGAKQFADYMSSDDPGLLRLVFQAWSPSLEAAVNQISRFNELVTALGLENLADTRAAMAKTLDADTLRNIERLASNLEGAWTATVTRLGASLIQARNSAAMAMGLFLVIRLGEDTRLLRGVENGMQAWRLAGQKAEALSHWTRITAQEIRLGRPNGIVNSPTVKASGGLLPLAVLVVNVLNAGTYARQAAVLEGHDAQRQLDSLSAYLYAGAALGAVIQNWLILGKGMNEVRLARGQLSFTAPTLTLFGGIVGGLSAAAAFQEMKSLRIQIDSAQHNIDPWLRIKQLAVTGQVTVYAAQALLGLGLTGMRLSNKISTPTAIKYFRLGMGPTNLLLLALGGLYLFAWSRQASPLQSYLANCCWSHRRAGANEPIAPQAQMDEINELMLLLYQPRLAIETRQVRIRGALGDTITQDGISQLTIDLPGAAPGAAQIDLAMTGNLTPFSAGLGTGTQGTPTDLGATWLNASQCDWIPVDAGQGLRLSGGFVTPLTRLSLRLCYLSPVALLAVGAPIGGARGQAYTLSPNGGLLNPGGEIITLRPGEPTPELDRASVHRLGPHQHSNYLQPKGDA